MDLRENVMQCNATAMFPKWVPGGIVDCCGKKVDMQKKVCVELSTARECVVNMSGWLGRLLISLFVYYCFSTYPRHGCRISEHIRF